VQTFASAKHVDAGVPVLVTGGEFFWDESTQPAVTRSRDRVIRILIAATVRDDDFVFVTRMVFHLKTGIRGLKIFRYNSMCHLLRKKRACWQQKIHFFLRIPVIMAKIATVII
jgi:hypothetical protein